MTTEELIKYIKDSIAIGQTKDQIQTTLINDGWSSSDISEAFLIVDNIQLPDTRVDLQSTSKSKKTLILLISAISFFLLASLAYAGWYFYSPEIKGMLGLSVEDNLSVNDDKSENNYTTEDLNNETLEENDSITIDQIPTSTEVVRDCGVSSATFLERLFELGEEAMPISEIDDNTLKCLGESAISCSNAKGTSMKENDGIFNVGIPNQFEIVKNGNSCSFRLAYTTDFLMGTDYKDDLELQEYSGQYIQCPLNIVKDMDYKESEKLDKFVPRELIKDNPTVYALKILMYGIDTIYSETSVSYENIKKLGCTGGLPKIVTEQLKAQRTKALINEVKSQVDELHIESIIFYDNNDSYENICSTEAFIKVKNYLNKYPEIADSSCFDSVNDYSFSAKLPSGKYYCVDATQQGFTGLEINTKSNKVTCN